MSDQDQNQDQNEDKNQDNQNENTYQEVQEDQEQKKGEENYYNLIQQFKNEQNIETINKGQLKEFINYCAQNLNKSQEQSNLLYQQLSQQLEEEEEEDNQLSDQRLFEIYQQVQNISKETNNYNEEEQLKSSQNIESQNGQSSQQNDTQHQDSQNYQQNIQLFHEFYTNNSQKLDNIFNQYAEQIQDENEEEESAILEDSILSFLIQFLDDKELGIQDYDSIQSYFNNQKKAEQFKNILKNYFEENGTDKNNLKKDELPQFFEYWMRYDKGLVLNKKKQNQQQNKKPNQNNNKGDSSQGSQRKVKNDLDISSINNKQTLQKKLNDTIQKYEDELNTTEDNLEKKILLTTLDQLRNQLKRLNQGYRERGLSDHMSHSQISQKKQQNQQEYIRKQHLKNIYDFYCKQAYFQGKSSTFDRIQHESNTLDLFKFSVICKHYNLLKGDENINRETLVKLFKKNATYSKEANFEQFQQLIHEIAKLIYPQSEDYLNKTYEKLKLDSSLYKDQMKLEHFPFNSREQVEKRTLSSKPIQKVQRVQGKTPQEIKEELIRRKQQRDQKRQDQQLSKHNNFVSTPNQNNKTKRYNKPDNFTGQQILMKQKGHLNKNKVTWDKLENITFNDLNKLIGNDEEGFNPQQLFDQDLNNEEDFYYLSEFEPNQKSFDKGSLNSISNTLGVPQSVESAQNSPQQKTGNKQQNYQQQQNVNNPKQTLDRNKQQQKNNNSNKAQRQKVVNSKTFEQNVNDLKNIYNPKIQIAADNINTNRAQSNMINNTDRGVVKNKINQSYDQKDNQQKNIKQRNNLMKVQDQKQVLNNNNNNNSQPLQKQQQIPSKEHNYLKRLKDRDQSPQNLSSNVIQRANQIQKQQDVKRNNMMQNLNSKNQRNMAKGLNAAFK